MSETYATYKVWDGCRAPVNLEYNGRLMGQIVREFTIDRDALLKLADDMDAYTECDDERCGKEMPPSIIHDYARRIRKALGVER